MKKDVISEEVEINNSLLYIYSLIKTNTGLLQFKCAYDQALEDLECLGYIYLLLLDKQKEVTSNE